VRSEPASKTCATSKLFNTPPPPDTPFAAAKLGQFWVVAAGWAQPGQPAGLLLGPELVIATPPRITGPGEQLTKSKRPPHGLEHGSIRINSSTVNSRGTHSSHPVKRAIVYWNGAKRMVGNRGVGERFEPAVATFRFGSFAPFWLCLDVRFASNNNRMADIRKTVETCQDGDKKLRA
jgi:hypothetical protein